MTPARFSPKAAYDLEAIFRFIASDNPEAAQHVHRNILNAADFLAEHPEIGRRIRNASPRHAEVRWFVVPKFHNYLIFYRPFHDTVLVARVLHAARDWTRFFPVK